MSNIDNIVIGEPLVDLQLLGVSKTETTVRFTMDELRNEKGDLFLPNILQHVEFFKSNGQIRQINQQRQKTERFKKDPDQDLWRNITCPEFTEFKIGKRVFWLIVGE